MGARAASWHARRVRVGRGARGRREVAGWWLLGLVLGCRPDTLEVELPILEGTRAAVLAVVTPEGARVVAFEPPSVLGEGRVSAPWTELELDSATGLELALYRCDLEALGLDRGLLQPAASGAPLPPTRCGFERGFSEGAGAEEWSHQAGLTAALAGLRVERGAEACFPSRVEPECVRAEGAEAGYEWRAPPTAREVLGTGPMVSLEASGADFGRSLALEEDLLVVGDPRDASCAIGIDGEEDDDGCVGAGAAHVYRWSPGGWRREAYLKPSDTHGGQSFGGSVAVSGDTVLVGAHRSSDCPLTSPALPVCLSMGAAYVFRRTEQGWVEETILTPSLRRGSDWFGQGVALRGDWAAVGTPGQDSCGAGPSREDSSDGCTNSGAVYLFERAPEGWVQRWILKAENPEPFAQLGRQVRWQGRLLVAPTSSRTQCQRDTLEFAIPSPCQRSSTIELFGERSGGEWRWMDGLRSPVVDSNPDAFISALTDGGRVFLGHPGEESCVPDAESPAGERCASIGAVHVFEARDERFVATQTLRPAVPRELMYFGVSMALSRDVLLVGASGQRGCRGPGGYYPCDPGGAALAFRRNGSGYVEEAELSSPPTDSESTSFGSAVAVSEGFAAVGDPWRDGGAVFVYEPPR